MSRSGNFLISSLYAGLAELAIDRDKGLLVDDYNVFDSIPKTTLFGLAVALACNQSLRISKSRIRGFPRCQYLLGFDRLRPIQNCMNNGNVCENVCKQIGEKRRGFHKEMIPGFPPIQKQVSHTQPSYSQYDSRLIILWTIKVHGSSLTIFWAIYGSVYVQPGTINLYGPEYGQPGAIKRKLG